MCASSLSVFPGPNLIPWLVDGNVNSPLIVASPDKIVSPETWNLALR